MTLSSIFSSFFKPSSPTKCQPSHEQRHRNEQLTEQLLALDLQSIRKQHGSLDERFQKVIDDANIQSAFRVEKYMKQIRFELQKVDSYCVKSHKFGTKNECIEEMDGLILEKFEKPFIKSQLNLYKVANLCLIKGGSLGSCVEEVKKQSFRSLQEGVNNLKTLITQKCT